MKTRTLLIELDEIWTPTIFFNADSDTDTARLQEIADRINHALIHNNLLPEKEYIDGT